MPTPNDLLIIGAGTLGSLVAKSWREKYASAEIIAETRTSASHEKLKSLDVTPNISGEETRAFPNVVFCTPPGTFGDYSEALKKATERVLPEGRFVFTSSTSVYGNVEIANEHTPTTNDERGKRMADAENVVLGISNGFVVRLPGLYAVDRGGHLASFASGTVFMARLNRWNFLYYEDAASIVLRILSTTELEERVFLASALKECSTEEFMDALLKHPRFVGVQRPRFLNNGGGGGRQHENSLTRRILDWKPRYESVSEFVDVELRRGS